VKMHTAGPRGWETRFVTGLGQRMQVREIMGTMAKVGKKMGGGTIEKRQNSF